MAHEPIKRTWKVVCIEDEAPMVELLGFILKTNGFEGHMAMSGQEGLELIRSLRPDLVLLDLMLPGMDGWEVYQHMKADEIMRAIPVIIVTSKAHSIDETLARNIAKVDDYITKPFNPKKLAESIVRILGISRKTS